MINQTNRTIKTVTQTMTQMARTQMASPTHITSCQDCDVHSRVLSLANPRYSQLLLMAILCGVSVLTGCQSMADNTSVTRAATPVLSAEQAKLRLHEALFHSLRRNQDWVSMHQLYLLDSAMHAPNSGNHSGQQKSTDALIDCQTTHDHALVAQLLKDGLDSFAAVATLSEPARAPYERIKTEYLSCYDIAAQKSPPPKLIELTSDHQVDKGDKKNTQQADTADEEHRESGANSVDAQTSPRDPLSAFESRMSLFGFSSGQISSLNNFATKSGNITTTGVYRPLSGLLAIQFDAGFENKNLTYHYRLPMVANWKTQAMYIKPDVVMPKVALYLDNTLGMTWQPMWYKFTAQSPSQQLPMALAIKQWLAALQASIIDLPASQFQPLSLAQFAQAVSNDTTNNLSAADKVLRLQAIPQSSTIIHWQQSAKAQDNWHQDVIERFIQGMDQAMATQYANQPNAQQAWQQYHKKLSQQLEARLLSEPTSDQRFNGQSLYIVMTGDALQQIWASHRVIYQAQPMQINTWVSFSPKAHLLATPNQPETLLQLASSIRDNPHTTNASQQNNVIDGRAEVKRLVELDNSRRLFGQHSSWLTWLDKWVNPVKADDAAKQQP